MKTKVLIIVTKSNVGGAQRYVYDLATHMPKDRFEVVVATGKAQGEDRSGRQLPGASLKVHKIFNRLDAVPFVSKEAAREHLRSIEPLIRPDVPLIGTIAELVPNKNLTCAIDACAILKEREKKFAYVIVGT